MPNRTLCISEGGVLDIRRDGYQLYLDLEGQPLYLLGVACETCQAIFSRVRDLDLPLAPQTFSAMLAQGIDVVSDDIAQTVRPLLPRGSYMAELIEVTPTYATSAERPAGVECSADYYWWQTHDYPEQHHAFELLLPCVAEQSLDPQRVAWYRAAMERGERPTSLALSMLDRRARHGQFSQWALAHFLLDGHHKVMAASQLGVPITVLSFLYESTLSGTRLRDPLVYEHYETHARR